MMGKSQKVLFRGHLKIKNQVDLEFYHFGDVYIGTLKMDLNTVTVFGNGERDIKILRNRFGKFMEGGIILDIFTKMFLFKGS